MKSATINGDASVKPVESAQGRVGWLDAVRGIGILLVVVGHALGGLIDSPLDATLAFGRETFLAIYSFHMPLFFLLSGLFVGSRIERDPAKFRRTILTTLVWPYFLWSAVQWTVIYQMGSLVNHPAEDYWPTIARLPWSVVSHFWFLHTLFFLQVLALLLLPKLGAVTFFLFCIALKGFATEPSLIAFVRSIAEQAPAYGLGVLLGSAGLQAVAVDRPVWLRALGFPAFAAALLGLFLYTTISQPDFATMSSASVAEITRQFAVWPVAIGCIVAIVGLTSLVRGPVADMLRYLGSRTMVIFVLHIMAIAGTRIILSKFFNVTDLNVLIPALIAAGLAFPLIADAILQRLRISKYLGL